MEEKVISILFLWFGVAVLAIQMSSPFRSYSLSDKLFPNSKIKAPILKADKKLVTVTLPEGKIETGLKKFGAMLGDEVEVGCGSVLNPCRISASFPIIAGPQTKAVSATFAVLAIQMSSPFRLCRRLDFGI